MYYNLLFWYFTSIQFHLFGLHSFKVSADSIWKFWKQTMTNKQTNKLISYYLQQPLVMLSLLPGLAKSFNAAPTERTLKKKVCNMPRHDTIFNLNFPSTIKFTSGFATTHVVVSVRQPITNWSPLPLPTSQIC